MSFYDGIDVFVGIDVNKSSKSKECHYWYFLNKVFNFQSNACNGCRDFLMMSISLSSFVIVNIKGSNYCCIIRKINENEAINIIQNDLLTKKNKTLKNKKKIIITYKNG